MNNNDLLTLLYRLTWILILALAALVLPALPAEAPALAVDLAKRA